MDCWLTGQQQQQQPLWMAGSPTLASSILQGGQLFLSSVCYHVTHCFQFPAALQEECLPGRRQVIRSQPICTLSKIFSNLNQPTNFASVPQHLVALSRSLLNRSQSQSGDVQNGVKNIGPLLNWFDIINPFTSPGSF